MPFDRTGRRTTRLLLAATAVGALLAAATFTPSLRNVTAELEGGRVSIGAVSPGVSLIGAAFAQAVQNVVIEDVRTEFAGQTLRVPRIELSGLNIGRAELIGLFDPKASEPLAARLSRIKAQRIAVPQAILEQKVGEVRSSATYRNVVATDIKDGRIARATVESGTTEVSGNPQGNGSGTTGRITAEDIDAAGMAEFYVGTADGEAPMKRLQGLSVAENITFSAADGVTMTMARVSARDFYGRPSRDGWLSTFQAMGSFPKGDKTSDEDNKRALKFLGDMFGSMDFGTVEMSGMEVRGPKQGDALVVKVARMAYEGTRSGRAADARLEGLEFAAKDARGKIGLIAFTGFSLAPTFEGMKALADVPKDQVGPDQVRKLIPTIGTVRFSGLDFDVPPSGAPEGAKPKNVRFGIKDIELTADQPINGIPTNLRAAIRNFVLSLAPDEKQDGLKDLVAMGYKSLDLSFTTAARYDAAANALDVSELSLQGAGMGAVALRGNVGNVTKDVFDADSAIAAVALLGATARSLELTVEDKGLAERLVAREAKRAKSSPEELRREYGMAAAVGVPALLGNSAQSKAVSQALARFVAKPGRLVISARAKNPDGLGAADFAALTEPSAVLEQLEVTARAE